MKCASVIVAAALAWAATTPAQASVIVQTDSEANQFGFAGFNSNLGTLNSVTLEVTISQQYRDWYLYVPSTTPETRDVQWAIDGIYLLFGWTIGNANFSLPFTEIPITGSGSTTVQLTPNTFLGEAFGMFTTMAGGSASFTLDPADFVYDILLGEPRIYVTGNDTGYYDAGTDTTFTIAGEHRLVQPGGVCNGGISGDDFCGVAGYTLTYNYTPIGEVGAVPEPSTWAMLLLGFGVVGFAMRRLRSANAAKTHVEWHQQFAG